MKTESVQIVDRGRGPQLSDSRLTVLDVFYYLHRGYEFDLIHRAMPSLTREQFEAIVHYVNEHHDELVERDRRTTEFHARSVELQHERGGIFASSDENVSTAERVARLKEKMEQKLTETNGAGRSD